MSLVGFRARNHPQQTDRRGALPTVDDRTIHPDDFALLHERFDFTIDAAASGVNARLPRYWSEVDDALAQDWTGERVWCNPPYSNIGPWVDKAWSEWTAAGCIVMLLPANRTEQAWWQELVEPFRDQDKQFRVEFLRGRMRFIQPGRADVGPNERPPFGCCLLIWGIGRSLISPPRGVDKPNQVQIEPWGYRRDDRCKLCGHDEPNDHKGWATDGTDSWNWCERCPNNRCQLTPMDLCERCSQPTSTPPLCAECQRDNDDREAAKAYREGRYE